MAYKLRDEADVIEDNVRYHFAPGNPAASSPPTTAPPTAPGRSSRRYEEAGLMQVFDEPGDDFRREAEHWLTRMARYAATELGADWVILNDADEFWWPVGAATHPRRPRERPRRLRHRHLPALRVPAAAAGAGSFAERMVVREARSRLRPKVAHRAHPRVVVMHRGAHEVALADEGGERVAIRSPGRPVLRGAREDHDLGDDQQLAWAPEFPLRTLHFPLRSYEQFERKVRTTVMHGSFANRGNRRLVRERFEEGRLREYWDAAGARRRRARDRAGRRIARRRPPPGGVPAPLPGPARAGGRPTRPRRSAGWSRAPARWRPSGRSFSSRRCG